MLKVLDEECRLTKGSKFSACIDLRASEDMVIRAGETVMIGLGVCIDINSINWDEIIIGFNTLQGELLEKVKEDFLQRHYIQLMLRSSLGKRGLVMPNGVGVIDLDYKDEIKLLIHNPISKVVVNKGVVTDQRCHNGGNAFFIKKGERIAQVTLLQHRCDVFGVHTETNRDGGFGSTNKK